VRSASEWREILAEVNQAGGCAHPVRLEGIVLDRVNGELIDTGIVVPCKDRRAAVCPSCSRLYQADAWQLVAAGIRGGKGVSADVVAHPQLFVTLTAPSFGPVHSRSRTGVVGRLCRPRRGAGSCLHGLPVACHVRHPDGDPVLGEPLCAECFDYRAAVLWNAHVPALWERTSSELYRAVAKAGGVSTREVRSLVRLSYMKVVEFQQRGLVHLHVVIRADGRDGPSERPPSWLSLEVFTDAVNDAVSRAGVAVPGVGGLPSERASWGSEHDVRVLVPGRAGDSTAIAAYVAKYATKTADGTPWLAHPIRSTAQLERLQLRPHIVRLVRESWALGQRKELRSLRLRAHAHTLGYTGQFSSKSLLFSTTFGALREARVLHVKGDREIESDYDGEWRYAGRGYVHPESGRVAESLREASSRAPRHLHTSSTNSSTTP
jgi:hypothetical protein